MYNNNWYKNLNKSSLTPPNWVFGIVWPILYTLLAISFIFTFTSKKCKGLCTPLKFFIIQMILNLSWTTIFFKYNLPIISLIVIILIIFFTILTYKSMSSINKFASYLLLPYLFWLCFATYLNSYIVFNN
jgi:translocator protein